MRKVTIVVPVLMTNCQVSENWKSGPLMPHATTTPAANRKVEARPAASEVLLAKSPKNFEIRDGSFFMTQPSTNHNVVWGPKFRVRNRHTLPANPRQLP